MTTIRTFIAIQLPPAVENHLLDLITQLSRRWPAGAVRWVQPHQLHLTVCFLGKTAVSQLPALQQTLDEVALQKRPFTLHLNQLGCFPNCQQPRVLWVGLGGAVRHLQTLHKATATALEPLGFAAEKRRYNPHLTLGRVKNGRLAPPPQWQTTPVQPLSFPITQIHLIESQLTPSGASYTPRHSSPFGHGSKTAKASL